MRVLVQRVLRADVTVEGSKVGAIERGLLLFIGIGHGDTAAMMEQAARKMANLRIFSDDSGRMNRSVLDVGGAALVISQFTLYGDVKKGGNRPSFDAAARPEKAKELYEVFVEALRGQKLRVETGVFQADMQVELVNDGPVTLSYDLEGS